MACDLPKLKGRLCEAEDALHDLATGKSVRVVVDHNGERVEYGPASMRQLRVYIGELKSEIAKCEGNSYNGGNQAFRPWGL